MPVVSVLLIMACILLLSAAWYIIRIAKVKRESERLASLEVNRLRQQLRNPREPSALNRRRREHEILIAQADMLRRLGIPEDEQIYRQYIEEARRETEAMLQMARIAPTTPIYSIRTEPSEHVVPSHAEALKDIGQMMYKEKKDDKKEEPEFNRFEELE